MAINLKRIHALFKQSTILILVFSLSLLSGCISEEKEVEVSEKKAAILFFDALYNEKNTDKVLALSSDSFKKELSLYHTASNMGRRVFNMSFESVTLHASAMKTQIIDKYLVRVTMMVQFTGKSHDGGIRKDYKRIRVIKEHEKWVVDKLLE